MRNFKNNFRRHKYKNNSERNRHGSINEGKIISNLSNSSFQRKNIGRNINPNKLVEKYSNLAREALSNGDKILSENYFQHAEHFIRVLSEKDNQNSRNNLSINGNENNLNLVENKTNKEDKKNLDNEKLSNQQANSPEN